MFGPGVASCGKPFAALGVRPCSRAARVTPVKQAAVCARAVRFGSAFLLATPPDGASAPLHAF